MFKYCSACFRPRKECEIINSMLNCDNIDNDLCNTVCYNEECLSIHKLRYCFKRCQNCKAINSKRHNCDSGRKWCKNFEVIVNMDHTCYINPEDYNIYLKKLNKIEAYVFYDFEAYVDNDTHNHKVNLAIAYKVCLQCMDKLFINERCLECKSPKKFQSVDEYCEWALDQKNTIHIAHNAKGYDSVFIFNYIIKNRLPFEASCSPSNISNGTKIMSLKWKNVKFIDSSLFIPSPLASFSKTFGITEKVKGFFPHEFNQPKNFNYVGNYPSKSSYGYDFMTPETRDKFDNWYKKQS